MSLSLFQGSCGGRGASERPAGSDGGRSDPALPSREQTHPSKGEGEAISCYLLFACFPAALGPSLSQLINAGMQKLLNPLLPPPEPLMDQEESFIQKEISTTADSGW